MRTGGIIITTSKKFIGTIVPAKILNARIGIMGQMMFPKKAIAVVLEVKAIALTALLNVYAILFYLVSMIFLSMVALCIQASYNTNISSHPMPSTM